MTHDKNDKGKNILESSKEEFDTRKSRGRPVVMVITGGEPEGASARTIKRKWMEIQCVASTSATRNMSSRPPLSFGDEDLLNGKVNEDIPLLISQ